jgi:Uma2 family endonuclease
MRGLEPDECFWIANEPRMRGKEHLNLAKDPPPDLALEVDVTHSSMDRMGIYSALQVPEVWRLDKGKLSFHGLNDLGQYELLKRSRTFPSIAASDLQPFLNKAKRMEENALVREFREWIRGRAVGRK